MRRIKNIFVTPTPPPTDCIWLNRGEFKYYNDGEWVKINNITSITNVEGEEAEVKAPIIRLGNTFADMENNIKVCSELGVTKVVSVDVEGVFHNIQYDAIGIYHNGTVSILEGNHCTVFDIDFNTGQVTLDSKYDTSKLLPYVDLEIGNSAEVKAYNLERLRLGHFFVQVDYGYGVGSWNPSTGGHAHIVTAYGNTVYYDLGADGIVVKELESPDLYLEYKNQGGTKTPTEFISELVNLLG